MIWVSVNFDFFIQPPGGEKMPESSTYWVSTDRRSLRRSRAWFAPQASKRKPARKRASLELAGRLQQDADVGIPVFLLKQDVFSPHLALGDARSEEHTSELQSRENLVC